MTGISQVMSRISQIQSMAARVDGSFEATLGSTMSATAQPAETLPTVPTVTTSPAPASTDLMAEPSTGGTGLPAGAQRWQPAIERAAAANGIDPKLLNAVVWVESGFDPNAVSHAGAIGLAQLMPGTAEGLGVDPYDPEQNLQGGARFLAAMIDRFGRVDLALAAYNAGPARVSSLFTGGPGVPVAEGYVSAVLDRYNQIGANT